MDTGNIDPIYAGQTPVKILVVEDDKAVLRLIQKSLTRAGFHTEVVSNGTEALKKLSDNQFTILSKESSIAKPTRRILCT